MNAVDTNVLVRLLARDDPHQVERAEQFIAQGSWVSHLVLAETVWVLESVYGLDRGKIATMVGMLLDHVSLAIQQPDVVDSALARFLGHKTVDFSDCLILEIARAAGHKALGTFDQSLAKLAGAKGL